MKMKKLVSICLLGIAIAGLTACGKKEEESKTKENEISVAAWAYDTNPEFKAMIEAFEKAENAKVKVVDIAADQYEDKVTTMLSAGDTTDVLAIKNVGSYANYASKGQLLDLSESVKKIDTDENYKGNLEGYEFENKYYGLPFRKDIYVLFYNKKLFDDYEKLAAQLTTKKDGQNVYGTYHHTWYAIMMCTAANQTGNTLTKGDYSFTEDYFNRWLEMQDKGYALDYSSIKTTNITYASQFETEKTAMMPMGSFYLGKLLNAAKEGKTEVEWGIATMPQEDPAEVKTYGGATGFSVNKASKNQKLAKKFVEFCSGEEGAKAVASIGMTPAYQSEEVMKVLFDLEGMPQDEESKKALQPEFNGWEMLPNKNVAEIDEIIKEEYDLMMVGDSSVKEGLKEMESRVKEIAK